MSRTHSRTLLKAADSYYTMRLSASSVTVRAGHRTRIAVSFQTTAGLDGTQVALSVSGLRNGVTASFSPSTTTIGSRSVLTLTTASLDQGRVMGWREALNELDSAYPGRLR